MEFDIPQRPTTASEYTEKYLKIHFKDSMAEINDIIELMAEKKLGADLTGYWSLDAFSYFTWRKRQKNGPRDFHKFAAAVYYEEMYVSEYRQALFDCSNIACFIRTNLKACLSAFVKPYNVIYQGKVVTKRSYVFPDAAEKTHLTDRPKLNVKRLVKSNDQVLYLANARKSIQGIKKSITNHYCAKRVPGSKDINPEVETALASLEAVRLLSFPSSSFQAYTLPGPHQERKRLAEDVS